MKNKLTDRQKQILDFIENHAEENGYPPSLREIGREFDIASTFGVKRHIDALVKKGYLTVESNTSRGLNVVNRKSKNSGANSDNIFVIPIVGRVAAGYPILAEENIEGQFSLDKALIGNKAGCFGLKVRGDSMTNAGIFEGDTVIVSPQKQANNNEIIVALLGDETTMKRFRVNNNDIFLQPENEAYEPIHIKNREDFSIIGKVIGVLRLYN